MSPESKKKLTSTTIRDVHELIKINRDSRETLKELADLCDNVSVAAIFRELATERNRNVAELEALVLANGEHPSDAATVSGAWHRLIISLRSVLGAGTDVMLSEAESVEKSIRSTYEEMLTSNPGSAASDILHRQLAAIRAASDRLMAIHEAYRRARA